MGSTTKAAEEASLAGLLRAALAPQALDEKRMFGGTCFLKGGHMVCGTFREGVIFRVGEAAQSEALARPGTSLLTIQERAMKGFVSVPGARIRGPDDLAWWLGRALAFVATLPPKTATAKKKAKAR